jgi:hypothetical protein
MPWRLRIWNVELTPMKRMQERDGSGAVDRRAVMEIERGVPITTITEEDL